MESKFSKYAHKDSFQEFRKINSQPRGEILVGVFGDPGSGKSQFIEQLRHEIAYFAGRNNIRVTVFESNAEKDLPPV